MPEVKEAPPAWVERFGGERMLIPTPAMIMEVLRGLPKGALLRVSGLRAQLAEAADADFVCPLTSGIFLRIAAEATEEESAETGAQPLPWWRVIKDDGTLNEKLPGGGELQAQRLKDEGYVILPKGKSRKMVREFEKYL